MNATKQTLYSLAAELAFLTEAEELTPETEAALDAVDIDLRSKVDGCCRLIQEWKGEAARFAAEAERLAAIADQYARRADSLKDYVKRCLELAGQKSLETELFRLRIQSNPPSVDVVGDAPPQFARVKVSWDWDKKAVIAAWKAGESVPGAEVRVGTSLRGVG
jgi:hypothetical protein